MPCERYERYDIEEIKRRISCTELLRSFGAGISDKGFTKCVFHAEKTGSMKVWDDHVYCFGCHAHGDVIDLAKELYDSHDTAEVLRMLCGAFGIGTVSDTRELAKRAHAARQKARERTERIEKLKSVYYRLIAEYNRLETNRERYAPRSPTETELHPLFRESLNRLALVGDAVQRCEWAIIDAEKVR